MKKVLWAVLLVVLSASQGWGQRIVDNWSSEAECRAAISGPYHIPTTKHEQKLAADERIAGLPHDVCANVKLPGGKYGWVKNARGTPGVFRGEKYVRELPCNNDVAAYVEIPEPTGTQGSQGRQGLQGPPGPPGSAGRDFTPVLKKSPKWPYYVAAVAAGVTACAIWCRSHSSSESSSTSTSSTGW